jgi:hypothetical protein
MVAHDLHHSVLQPHRVAEPPGDAARDPCADLGVAARTRLLEGFAEVVDQRREPDTERRLGVRGGLDDVEDVLVERHRLALGAEVVADRGSKLGDQVTEHAGVAREPQRARRCPAEQELRQLSHAVGGEAAADALGGDVVEPACFESHLRQRLTRRLEPELRDEADAHEPQRVRRSCPARARAAGGGRGRRAAEGIDEHTVREAMAIALMVKSRRAMSSRCRWSRR